MFVWNYYWLQLKVQTDSSCTEKGRVVLFHDNENNVCVCVKVNVFIFDIAEYDYENQMALLNHNLNRRVEI